MTKFKFFLILNSIWAIPMVLIFRFINKFKKISIIKIRSDRFGHFASDGAEQVARYQKNKIFFLLYFFDGYICNEQWAKMLRKALPVYNCLRAVHFYDQYFSGGKTFSKNSSETGSRDINLLYTKFNVKLPFESYEEKKAISWLESKGWKKGEKFYCILIRDNSYLKDNSNFKDIDWGYHDYRNSEISTYYKAINWLLGKNIYVIRMGKIAAKPLEIKNKKFIDFPFENNKSDLIDTWLFANCDGCISTGSGPDILSGIYEKKILFINYIPLFNIRSDLNSITHPKTLKWKKNKRELTVDEYIKDKRLTTAQYRNDEVIIYDMTQNEILDVVKEFYFKNENKYIEESDIKIRQKQFWEKILKENKRSKSKFHNRIHSYSNVSSTWLKKHK